MALAALRAEELATTSPEYEALADAVGYALDLADLAHAAQRPASSPIRSSRKIDSPTQLFARWLRVA